MSDHDAIWVYGEILIDEFPDNIRHLGGCSLNVAWHLKGLGLDPVLISRVGNDERGKWALQKIKNWGLITDFIQVDKTHPTGVVEVTLDKNFDATYECKTPAAFDFIEMPTNIKSCDLLYFGSFGIRHISSLNTLKLLVEKAKELFVDINLRPPFYLEEAIEYAKSHANYLKVNEIEMKTVFQNDNLKTHQFKKVFLTKGENGISVLDNEQDQHFPSVLVPKDQIVNTVGAGDAFCASIISSIINGKLNDKAYQEANYLAAKICKIEGANCSDKTVYDLDNNGP